MGRKLLSSARLKRLQSSGQCPAGGHTYPVLEPKLLIIFRKDPENGTDCILSRFLGDSKMEGVFDALEGCAAIERDFNKLEK